MNHSPFSVSQFTEHRRTHTIGASIQWFEELDSTNRYANSLDKAELQEGMIIGADFQRAGRGQHNRTWESEASENLLFSIVLTPTSATRLRVLLGMTALSVCDLLNEYGAEAFIKWPNDVFVGKQKICGILTETVFSGSRCERVIIGIGMNIHQTSFSSSLSTNSTSFSLLFGAHFSREKLLAEFCAHFEKYWIQWTRNLPTLIQSINKKILGVGEELFIRVNGKRSVEPIRFLGIDDEGIAHILTPSLTHQTFQHEQLRFETP